MVHSIESNTFILFRLSIHLLIPVPLQFKRTSDPAAVDLPELGCRFLYLRQGHTGSAWASFMGTWPVQSLRALCSKRPCWVYCPAITTLKFVIIFEQGATRFHFATEAEALILWPPNAKNWLIGKDPGAGKDWRLEEKQMTEDEMIWWHHQLNGQEFEQAPGVGDGQGSLACCRPWSHKESDTTEWLNWTHIQIALY